MSDDDKDEAIYQLVEKEEGYFSGQFKPDHVYISLGISENRNPEIDIIDLTEEGSDMEQVLLSIAHSFVDFVVNNTTEAQRMGIKILTELEDNATEH